MHRQFAVIGQLVAAVGAHTVEHRRGAVDVFEDGLAKIALQIDAQLLLLVQAIGHRQRHATEGIHGGFQRVEPIAHQPPQLATADLRRDDAGDRPGLEGQFAARRFLGARHRGQHVGRIAYHQALAFGHEHVDGLVAVGHHGDVDDLGKVAHQLIALVQQIVGVAPPFGGHGVADGVVQRRDVLGDGGGIDGQRVELGIDGARLLLQPRIHGLEVLGQQARLRHQQLTTQQGRGVIRRLVQRLEELVHAIGQAAAGVGQQIVHLGDVGQIGIEIGQHGDVTADLIDDELLGIAEDVRDHHAAADIARSGGLGPARGAGHRLPRIAFSVGIDDVVTRDGQGQLAQLEPGYRGVDQVRHVSSLPHAAALLDAAKFRKGELHGLAVHDAGDLLRIHRVGGIAGVLQALREGFGIVAGAQGLLIARVLLQEFHVVAKTLFKGIVRTEIGFLQTGHAVPVLHRADRGTFTFPAGIGLDAEQVVGAAAIGAGNQLATPASLECGLCQQHTRVHAQLAGHFFGDRVKAVDEITGTVGAANGKTAGRHGRGTDGYCGSLTGPGGEGHRGCTRLGVRNGWHGPGLLYRQRTILCRRTSLVACQRHAIAQDAWLLHWPVKARHRPGAVGTFNAVLAHHLFKQHIGQSQALPFAHVQGQLVVEVLLVKFHLVALQVIAFREHGIAVAHGLEHDAEEHGFELLGDLPHRFRRVLTTQLGNRVQTGKVRVHRLCVDSADHETDPVVLCSAAFRRRENARQFVACEVCLWG